MTDAGSGDNTIYAGDGNNTIYSAEGNDVIYAGSGDDTVYAGSGDDIIDVGSGSATVDGGTGSDRLTITLSLNSTYTTRTKLYDASGTAYSSITNSNNEFFCTSNLADIRSAFTSGVSRVEQYGSGGDFDINFSGIEQLEYVGANTGSDLLLAIGHNGRMYGGDGWDALYADWSYRTEGVTWDNSDLSQVYTVGDLKISGIERMLVVGTQGDDTFINRVNPASSGYGDQIDSGAGNDTIITGTGNDIIKTGKPPALPVDS